MRLCSCLPDWTVATLTEMLPDAREALVAREEPASVGRLHNTLLEMFGYDKKGKSLDGERADLCLDSCGNGRMTTLKEALKAEQEQATGTGAQIPEELEVVAGSCNGRTPSWDGFVLPISSPVEEPAL